jgi:hypothetical protein
MADQPEGLLLGRHRDLEGRTWQRYGRRAVLGLVTLVLVLGLLNVFGQRPATSRAAGPAATLKVYSPARVRSGLFFESRFHIHARRDLEHATVVLGSGWLEGMTLNTIEPSPIGEASRNGSLAFDLGHIPAGADHLLFLEFQVNPTNVGRREQNVELDEGETPLLKIHRTVTIWP